MTLDREIFHPARYSVDELRWLKAHLGEPPAVALAAPLPATVNRAAVEPLLAYVYELEQLREHRGQPWAGVDRMKEAIDRYLDHAARWQEWAAKGAPRFPTRYEWDDFGRPHLYGPGADTHEIRTVIDERGQRQPVTVAFFATDTVGTTPVPWVMPGPPPEMPTALLEDQELGRIECPVCHFIQTYEPGNTRQRNLARTRMARHLAAATRDVERHRTLKLHVFGS